MGAQGTATLNFGAFPGSSIASVDVVAAGVVSTSAVEAWIRPAASADHTDGDHIVTNMLVVGQYLSDGNIRIWGINNNDIVPPEVVAPVNNINLPLRTLSKKAGQRQDAPMLVGAYNVNWVWN